uniref:Protein Njmu-R1 n=1 Tax=Branchiostoma floridae TaxID=7739 RepID=C3ZM39_BRAFL|eukprot:XP_002590283.1 hypothetical protein BRAFLDRAFT_121352 [Branchiostoma floridae]
MSEDVEKDHLYALYTCHVNRRHSQEQSSNEASADPDPADPPEPDPNGDNFSLSVVATNMKAENEVELRASMVKRLSRGLMHASSGSVTNLDIGLGEGGSACYYRLLQPPGEEVQEIAELSTSPTLASVCMDRYIVCLVDPVSSPLDLFRSELDKFSFSLLSLLDAWMSQLEELRVQLARWFDEVTGYTTRCPARFQEDVSILLHVGLTGCQLTFQGPNQDDQLKEDTEKFVTACSLKSLLSTTPDDQPAPPSNQPLIEVDNSMVHSISQEQNAVVLSLEGEEHKFSCETVSRFCKNWGEKVLSASSVSAFQVRQMLDNFKLQVIQDMNAFKRLILQAETDHYALYRCLIFTQNCGHNLLQSPAVMNDPGLASLDSQDVLKVLQDHLK